MQELIELFILIMEKDNIDYSQELILIVDDDSHLREVLRDLLGTLNISSDSASNGSEALKRLEEREYTIVLTDMRMQGMDGLKLIEKIHDGLPNISIIAMTGYSEGYRYVDVINAGANDFINKPFDLEELEAKIRRIIIERDFKKELSRLSITDSLTGLYNQRHFYIRLKDEVTRAKRQKHPLSLILLDLDNFKEYNDTYGHLEGDEMLRHVGQIINNSIREGVDSGYRYGGDEFAIILIESSLNVAKEIGNRIQISLKEKRNITASIGYKKFSEEMSDKELVSEADKNLYRAKIRTKKTTIK